ncbi:hypothetical protein CDG77_19120 [Nostoc sp. 'Peltigera membranacea cyanobiont' 213]|uniref:hypothetical protein n=1 Tax=unclassified Nostoc TaxID=2593658 RepID=UPI000B95C5BF|nr:MULTISPECIES: hypothetical protein [unclassified Nostoc]AVH66707.1 hypothetical protein NPM_5256 [Nostoc sp. 'Peltigera membranacea cyanobiont' N6]OYD89376.1 hypothetical protein CDG77_19120 [Nostoc sp. 'Peltigera membranacea cyanobiont' 213]
MNIIVRLFGAIVLQVSALAAMSSMAMSDDKPFRVPTQETPIISQLKTRTTHRICSLDPIEDLLPPPQNKANNSLLSYLAEQGFTQNKEGSWVCYANDPKKEGRYFTMFKVKQVDGRLIASSFLDEGSLIQGQENRSLDFFMMLIEHHLNASKENRQGIRRYLEAFVSLVKEGKIKPTRRGFLFDQPNRALVLYHTLSSGNLKGTGITINISLPKS